MLFVMLKNDFIIYKDVCKMIMVVTYTRASGTGNVGARRPAAMHGGGFVMVCFNWSKSTTNTHLKPRSGWMLSS